MQNRYGLTKAAIEARKTMTTGMMLSAPAGNANCSRHLNFNNNGYAYVNNLYRHYGFAVRGVQW